MSAETIEAIKARVDKLETCYNTLTTTIGEIKTSIELLKSNYDSTKLLIQWVVFPLVAILGGLVGIKVLFPGV